MPTRRSQVRRNGHRITHKAVALFVAARMHRDLYLACIGGGHCQRPEPGRHCDVCRGHVDARRELHRALGLKPWEACPLDVSLDQSAWPRDGSAWAASLDQAKELRATLQAAALAGCTQSTCRQE